MGSINRGLFQAISVLAGEAHFIAQSTADAIAHVEGYLGHKLTGEEKRVIIAKRRELTKQQQADYKKCVSTMGQTFRHKFKAVPTPKPEPKQPKAKKEDKKQ